MVGVTSSNLVGRTILFSYVLRQAYPMEKAVITSDQSAQSKLPHDQLNLIERNLELSIDERINQLQSAVDLIEEMRRSLREVNENRF